MSDNEDEAVGYGRPPKHSRWQEGISGNPRGRPRGARSLKAELLAELNERVAINVEGKRKTLPKRRLVLKALANKALNGNVNAAQRLIDLIIQAEGLGDEAPAPQLSENDRLVLARAIADDPFEKRAANNPVEEQEDADGAS